ncbi:hypothetical protein INE66_003643 [Salmonella enterica subsp. enterica]|nr:hypothetical protein [Salmonella enterica subsp. enterica]
MALTQINTYGDLKEAVRFWLNRKDQATIDMIPNFINFAEKQFTRLVKLPYYESMVDFTINDQFNFVVIPQDMLSIKGLTVNGKPCTRLDLESFARLDSSNKVTRNIYFTRKGEQIHFCPKPIPGDRVTLIYAQDIPEMQFDLDQPYSLLIAPDILLYLSLKHASTWLRDHEADQYWEQKAQQAAAALMQQLDDAEWSGSALQVQDNK